MIYIVILAYTTNKFWQHQPIKHHPTMSMLLLSNELLLAICEYLEYCWDINSFAQTNCRLYGLLNRYLYRQNIRFFDVSALLWAAQHGNEPLVQNILDLLDDESDVHNDNIWEAMQLAAKHGHGRVIQVFLETSTIPFLEYEAKASQSEFNPQDLLSIAVKEGHESVVRISLAHGAGQNMMSKSLSYAAEKGSLSMFKLLVEEHNCSPESTDYFGWTPLMNAAQHGRVEIVEYLLKVGANPNHRNSDHKTPIYSAISGGQVEVFSLLMDYGARMDSMMLALYPLCHALESYIGERCMKATRFFMEHINLDKLPTGDHGKGVLLCVAAACGVEALVQRLLEHGCHPDATQVTEGAPFKRLGATTALMWATSYGHERVVRLLLEKGADPNHKKLQRDSVLSKAATLKTVSCEAIFKILLDHGADPTVGGAGESVLERALGSGKTALVRMLLDEELKIPPNIIRKNNRILSFAAHGGAEMLEFLFQHGFEPPDPKDFETDEAVLSSILQKNLPAFKFLLSKGYMPHKYRWSHVLDCAVEAGEVFLDLLLSRGVDLHSRDYHYRTCTWSTVFRRNAPDLRIILEKGADPLSKDDSFPSRLHQAAYSGFAAGVEVLLEYVPTTYMKHSHTLEDVKNTVLKAKEFAVIKKKWKCVRLLHRFYHCDLPKMEADT